MIEQDVGHGPESGVGALLRASRLRCGEELQDVAAMLRIRFPYLEAIEDGRYQDLPGATYAVGFVRTYAEHLGLDADEVVRRFKTETENMSRRTALVFPSPIAESSTPGGAIIFIGILVAAIAYGAWYVGTSKNSLIKDLISPLPDRLAALVSSEPAPDSGSVATTPSAAPAPVATAPAPAPATSVQTPSDGGPQALTPEPEIPATEAVSPQAPATPETAPAATAETAPQPPPVATQPEMAAAPGAQAPAPQPQPAATEPAPAPAAQPASPPPAASEPQVASAPEPALTPPPAALPEPQPVAAEPEPKPVVTAPEATPAPTPAAVASAPEPPAPAETAAPEPAPAAAAPEPAPAPAPVVAATAPAPEPAPPAAPPSPPAAPAAPAASQTPAAPADQVASIPAAPEAPAVTAPQGRVFGATNESASQIVVKAKEDAWIQVRDGIERRLLVTRLMRAGDTYRVPNRPGLTLLTGNAGALEIMVDGKPVPSIGGAGAVRRNVSLDPEKLKAGDAVLD